MIGSLRVAERNLALVRQIDEHLLRMNNEAFGRLHRAVTPNLPQPRNCIVWHPKNLPFDKETAGFPPRSFEPTSREILA